MKRGEAAIAKSTATPAATDTAATDTAVDDVAVSPAGE